MWFFKYVDIWEVNCRQAESSRMIFQSGGYTTKMMAKIHPSMEFVAAIYLKRIYASISLNVYVYHQF